LGKYSDNHFFIGLNRFGLTGQQDEFRWSDSTPLDWVNWARNEPNNYNDQESCVTIFNHNNDGDYNSITVQSS
jgi:hypothetical protein